MKDNVTITHILYKTYTIIRFNKNKLLRYDLIIYIFNNLITKKKILYINYNNFNIKHFSYKRIKKNIKFKYY